MQNKVVVAAAIAASSTALKLKETPKNELAQTKIYDHTDFGYPDSTHADDVDCANYGYAYECLSKKVDATLGAIEDDIADAKAACESRADDLRAQTVSGIQQLRAGL
jgi:hypothetical protein